MAGALEVEAVSGTEIKRVVDALRTLDKKAPARIRKQMRAIARTGTKVVKGKARSLPSKGRAGGTSEHPHKRRQLRRGLARGVKIQASTGGRKGVAMRIVTSMEHPRQAFLPRAFDQVHSWTHPVFAQPGRFAQQGGGYGWFVEPLGEMRPDFEMALRAVLRDAREELRRAGA